MIYDEKLRKQDLFNPEKRLKESLVSIFSFLKGVERPERKQKHLLSSAQQKDKSQSSKPRASEIPVTYEGKKNHKGGQAKEQAYREVMKLLSLVIFKVFLGKALSNVTEC